MTSPCFLQACRRFVNKNAVTEEAKSSTKTPELVAKYCDSLLRKGNKACGVFQTDIVFTFEPPLFPPKRLCATFPPVDSRSSWLQEADNIGRTKTVRIGLIYCWHWSRETVKVASNTIRPCLISSIACAGRVETSTR
jgi:hypothetical protein